MLFYTNPFFSTLLDSVLFFISGHIIWYDVILGQIRSRFSVRATNSLRPTIARRSRHEELNRVLAQPTEMLISLKQQQAASHFGGVDEMLLRFLIKVSALYGASPAI